MKTAQTNGMNGAVVGVVVWRGLLKRYCAIVFGMLESSLQARSVAYFGAIWGNRTGEV